MEIKKYPDGSSYINNTQLGLHNNSFKINSYEDLWHLNQAVDAYYNDHGSKPTITIPNLIDAQADRRFARGESSGLKLVCDLLNKMPANFKIFHPHNPEVVEALFTSIEIIDNSKFIKKVLDYISDSIYSKLIGGNSKEDNLILMSSDAGGFKPLMKLCNKINWKGETSSASKARIGNEMVQILPEITSGKDILIIDDISIKGGTFKGLSELIKETGFNNKLYLAVSHMTVENLGKDPVTNYFDEVFTTNSKFNHYYKETKNGGTEPLNLKILKLF